MNKQKITLSLNKKFVKMLKMWAVLENMSVSRLIETKIVFPIDLSVKVIDSIKKVKNDN